MKVAIIGAGGFIGHALAAHMAAMGHEVTAVDLTQGDPAGEGIFWRRADVTRDPVILDDGTAAVFYLAQTPFYRSFPDHAEAIFLVNTMGAINTAKAALARGVDFFCYASTGSIYQASFEPLSENAPKRRDDAYVLSKLMAEEALALFNRDMSVLSVRFFGVFGPGQRRMLPWKLFELVRDGRPVVLNGAVGMPDDKDGLRISFCYVEDTARFLGRLAALALEGTRLPSTLNIAGPEAISIRKYAETLGEIIGKKTIFEFHPNSRSFDLIADISRMSTLLDPEFTPLGEALHNTLRDLIP
jgi:nucleoside-diphosphate-sugar epimerase